MKPPEPPSAEEEDDDEAVQSTPVVDDDTEASARAASDWLAHALDKWRAPLPPTDRPSASNRWTRAILLAVVVGVATGLSVAGFEWIAGQAMLERLVTDADIWLQIVAPGIGLILAAFLLLWLGRGASPATADEYIRNYHEHQRMSLRQMPGRLAAAVATLGFGGPMGFEGPSIYIGAGVGDAIQRRFSRLFTRDEAKILMVAGAAAGVSAIFKTPATGAIFALEVPYQQDLASRAVVPALVSSASSYITFVAIYDTDRLLQTSGSPIFDFTDLLGAAALGLLCGVGANLFTRFLTSMKRVVVEVPVVPRVLAAALSLAALVGASQILFDEPLTLGPGFEAIEWATDPSHGAGLVAALLLMRAAATGLAISGGGVGGVFIPLVVAGALLGRLSAGLVGSPNENLFTAVGAAAFLGAGYRTPIAAVTFVAESTGQPGLVVPGLIATALSQFLMGKRTVAPYQQSAIHGHLEQRLMLPVSSAMIRDVHTCPPTASVDEIVQVHFLRARAESIPVVDDGAYLGMVTLQAVMDTDPEERSQLTAAQIMTVDLPVATLGWSLRQVSEAMDRAAVDRVAVIEADGRLAGLVTTTEILQLEDLLSDLEG